MGRSFSGIFPQLTRSRKSIQAGFITMQSPVGNISKGLLHPSVLWLDSKKESYRDVAPVCVN
jgi:hypothetical protein